jgi:hypothetical protein
MDELGQLILGSSPKSNKREPTFDEIKAAKKSYSGANPQLQPDSAPDELGQLILGSGQQKPEKQSGGVGSILQRALEMKQAAPATAASALDIVAGLPSMVAGTVGYGAGRLFGLSPEEAQRASQKIAAPLAEPVGQLTRTAGTQAYQQALPTQAMQKVGELAQKGIVEPVAARTGANELDIQNALNAGMFAAPAAGRAIGRGYAEAKAALPTVRVERVGQPGMQSGGAAAASNQAMLNEAINRASPELAAELRNLKPEQINKAALENQLVADTLPVPVRLTKGQASQDPSLISFERNERGMKEKLSQHFNEQNKALQENAEQIKQRTAEGTYETDYVANAERAIEAFKDINNTRQKEIKQAYDALDKLGAGKIEVDSKSFGNSALQALRQNEDIDFLPSVIKSKIEAYEGGKPMNFAQYENLRTQIARETRKAQRADDGNAVHALTIARSELEKLPLLNETAEAKAVADKARSFAAQEFGLLDKRRDTYNPVYAEIVNGVADTKDFVPKVVLRSKNADFAKAVDMLKDNPDAIKQLRAGTLDYIIRESTDASGNFKTAKFTQLINNLDVNKKLTTLFGEDSQVLKDLAKTGQLIEARPRGSFVNESNTSVANMASQYAKGAAEQGINVAAKGLPIGTMGRQFLEKRAAAKQVEETLKPGAGVKLKNIGKD